MINHVKHRLASLAMNHRALLVRLVTPVAVLVYPAVELVGTLHRVGASFFATRRFRRIGENVRFDPVDGHIRYEGLEVGDNSFLGAGARVWALSEVRIGRDVMFGPEVYIMNGYHRIDLVGKTIMDSGGDTRLPVVIEDDVWVGTRSTILKGVTIGQGSVIGAESLVTKSVPPYVVAAGNPCRVRSRRFTDEQLREHVLAIGQTSEQAERFIAERSRYFDERA